ncbi:MAG: YdiU family protein [Cyanobacteria bacterium J069]|nr:MAG: YdiU family protein [Cyanobacteria bacterium J069]
MTLSVQKSDNPLLNLIFEPAFEALGGEYADPVDAAIFPQHILRFRNDDLLPTLGLDPNLVSDSHFLQAFGKFEGRLPLLAMRYHGYQFGYYNPDLGDGRGFLYGQVRGIDGNLYDLGTKGSGTTPYSRGGDGRLTLKGGVREVLAAEMLQVMGVRTSRCLSLVETGEGLWRGDEPSPTRSAVMVRMQRSHIRFGTFERLHSLERPDLIRTLLDHVIDTYYPHLSREPDRDARFYAELVLRVAELAAQWMAAGFCHAVLNTDNMAITAESFDYGPYAFIERFDPKFTAAYFDHFGRYAYANQPGICRLNLELLQVPLKLVMSATDLEAGLAAFEAHYVATYGQRMLRRLGFEALPAELENALIGQTLQFLQATKIGYHEFFRTLREQFSPSWREDAALIFAESVSEQADALESSFKLWRQTYHRALNQVPEAELLQVAARLRQHNPMVVIVRPEIEAVWGAIAEFDNWEPFYDLLQRIRSSVEVA